MALPILATKFYVPPPRPNAVLRPHLIERLNEDLRRSPSVILASAPAGFGKTTLLSEWATSCVQPIAWLSLDEGDSDPTRFLTYLIAALQTVNASIGEGTLRALESPQLPPVEAILTTLFNEITSIPDNFILVLDDYHLIDSKPVDQALTFLLDHLPPQMHLVLASREDPNLPLARLRARNQLIELRATDLRFASSEAAEFLNEVMGLNLSAEDITALETRTEGWIAGLQLAALSMQGLQNTTGFIQSFTGSHHFVLDYLLEEVLQKQSESVQTFLLRTSILDRMCGPLCDTVLLAPSASGQETLEYLEHANLFIVPLDNDRHWYRYHHLFADLLRQRLHQNISPSSDRPDDAQNRINELHIRASQWYEDHDLEFEAFHHAALANDIERAERLIEGEGIPLHLRGAVTTILNWLGSLPKAVFDARPSLWWRYASLLLVNGQTTGVGEKLDAAESRLQGAAEMDDKIRNLIGRIATARAVLALTRYQAETMLVQSRRALEYLDADNLSARATANWTLGVAHYFFSGDRAAARHALTEALSLSQACGDVFTTLLATGSLGNVQEVENQLSSAEQSYQRVLQLAGDQPLQIVYDAQLGLARIYYEWNDLDAAEQHGQQSLQLARQYDKVIDRFIVCEVFLARLKLARGDVEGAVALLAQAEQSARGQNFVLRLPEIAAAQILTLLHQGNLEAAAALAKTHQIPISQARVYLAQGDTSGVLALLEPLRQQMEAKGWVDEQLKVMVLQAVALNVQGEKNKALQMLKDALALAEPGGFIRIFIDEGAPMAQLLSEAASVGIMPDYVKKLRAAFDAQEQKGEGKPSLPSSQLSVEQLSPRELEILRLIARGLSNDAISERLYLALSTVKGHNRNIFDKLHVQNRTEAVARARELDLL